jgi:ketosteroid isomerase-like protein
VELMALLADDERAIREMQRRWLEAEREGNWAAIGSMTSDDTVWVPPGQPALHGRGAVLEWAASLPGAPAERDEELDDVDGAGDLAYARGTYRVSSAAGDGTVATGVFLRLLRKVEGNRWLVTFDIWTE